MTWPYKTMTESWCPSPSTLWTWCGGQRGLQCQMSPFMPCRRHSQVISYAGPLSQLEAAPTCSATPLAEKFILRGSKAVVSCAPLMQVSRPPLLRESESEGPQTILRKCWNKAGGNRKGGNKGVREWWKNPYPFVEKKNMSCFSGTEDCFVLNHLEPDFWPSCDEEFRCKMAGVRWAGMDKGSIN